MKLARPRRLTSTGMNMTPMIDIVFLLIIFFMTVSQISRVTEQPVRLPHVDDGGEKLQSVAITINIDRSGNYIAGGKQHSLEMLKTALSGELQRLDGDSGRLRVLVRSDRRVSGKYVNDLIEVLEPLGVRDIRISVVIEGQSP